jgi:uncharacterized membrane protein YeiH
MLAFLAAETMVGTRAAFMGRALFAVNGAWDGGNGSSSMGTFVRTLVTGFAGGWLCPVFMLASPPVPLVNDMPVICTVAAWCLFFGTRNLFGKLYRSTPGQVVGIILECMFRANLVCTFTVKGSEKLGSAFGAVVCGVFAATGGAWLKDGYGAADNLVKPGTPMFLALLSAVGTFLCTHAEKYGFPFKFTPKEAQQWVVLLMIISELAKVSQAHRKKAA